MATEQVEQVGSYFVDENVQGLDDSSEWTTIKRKRINQKKTPTADSTTCINWWIKSQSIIIQSSTNFLLLKKVASFNCGSIYFDYRNIVPVCVLYLQYYDY